MNKKIKTLEELQQITADLKSQGKKVVHCHGVFDLLHIEDVGLSVLFAAYVTSMVEEYGSNRFNLLLMNY